MIQLQVSAELACGAQHLSLEKVVPAKVSNCTLLTKKDQARKLLRIVVSCRAYGMDSDIVGLLSTASQAS